MQLKDTLQIQVESRTVLFVSLSQAAFFWGAHKLKLFSLFISFWNKIVRHHIYIITIAKLLRFNLRSTFVHLKFKNNIKKIQWKDEKRILEFNFHVESFPVRHIFVYFSVLRYSAIAVFYDEYDLIEKQFSKIKFWNIESTCFQNYFFLVMEKNLIT